MNKTKKSFLAAGMVAAGAVAVLLGLQARDARDLDRNALRQVSSLSETLLASKTPADIGEMSSADFYSQMADLLKREYVDPVTDDEKLVAGAIRGMIASLQDPTSLYMDKPEFERFLGERQGKFEGIGVHFRLDISKTDVTVDPTAPDPSVPVENGDAPGEFVLPNLVVAEVVPGGPADKAGVKVGDRVDTVDGHWVLTGDLIAEFRALQKKVDEGKEKPEKLNDFRTSVAKKTETSVMPLKAKQMLAQGATGTIDVIWKRGKETFRTELQKSRSEFPTLKKQQGALALHFVPGLPEQLKGELPEDGSVTLDLRNNSFGDLAVARDMLALFLPPGEYGVIATPKEGDEHTPLKVQSTLSAPRPVTLIVDGTTTGAALMFAQAMQKFGQAKIQGNLSKDQPHVVEVMQLPDDGGFTLTIGNYKVGGGK